MGNYALSGTLALNHYLWERLQSDLNWTKIDNFVPIIPAAQQPELSSQSQPYIVYNYSLNPSGGHTQQEQVTYTVYGSTNSEVWEAVNFIFNVFQHFDFSAADVNAWLARNNEGYLQPLDIFDFKTIWAVSTVGPQPPTEEGGAVDGAVVIRCEYTRYINKPIDNMRSDDPLDTYYTG